MQEQGEILGKRPEQKFPEQARRIPNLPTQEPHKELTPIGLHNKQLAPELFPSSRGALPGCVGFMATPGSEWGQAGGWLGWGGPEPEASPGEPLPDRNWSTCRRCDWRTW